MNTKANYTDEQLVVLYSEGDNHAFETLLLRHKNKIYTYIFNIVREPNLADDIFQETFIKVIDTIKSGRYSSEGKFIGWVIRIAHNKVIDHFRLIANDKTITNDSDSDIFNNIDLCDNSHAEAMEREQRLRSVEHAITLLPIDQQRIVNMRYYKQLSFKQIADIEDISINTALGRMRYAIINMRKMFSSSNL